MVYINTKRGKAARAAALTVVGIGVSVLAGWQLNWELLKRVLPDLIAMNPASAVAFILGGCSLALTLSNGPRDQPKSRALKGVARGCAFLVALMGLTRLIAILGGLDFQVDRWLYPAKMAVGAHAPNRMAPNTAINFFLLGGSLWWLETKSRLMSAGVSLAMMFVGMGSLLAVLGYFYDIEAFYKLGPFMPMALHTAVTFLILYGAFLQAHSDRGLLAVLVGKSAGGTVGRRLLPAAVVVPAVLGWLAERGEAIGYYRGAFGIALFAVGSILVFTVLVCWSAGEMFKADLNRRKIEAAMREMDQKFHQLADNIVDIFWIAAPDMSQIIYVSPAYEQIFGRSVASVYLQAADWISALPVEEQSRVAADFARLAGGETSMSTEFPVVRPDGTVRWVLCRGFPVRDEQRKIIRLTGITSDITERKAAEVSLRESEARFRGFFEQTAMGVAHVALDGRFMLVNQRYADIVGRTREELMALTFPEITHPDDIGQNLANSRRLLDGEITSFSAKKRYLRKDGSPVWVSLSVSLIKDSLGRPKHYVTLADDITERKLADEGVQRLAAMVEHSADAIISKTMNGIITTWNPAAEKMFGYTAAEIIGQPLMVLVPADRAGEEVEILAGLARGEASRQLETVRLKKNGQRFDVSATISLIKGTDGHYLGASKIVRDISGRKRLESQLLQAQKLETVGKLAGGVAHEFNNILTAIAGQSEMMIRQLPPESPLARSAGEISLATGRAAALTRQLLAYGRRQILQPEILDLNQVLQEMKNTLRHLAGPKVDLRLVPAAGLRKVKMDPGQLEQVIVNLTLNAAAAMPQGGKFTLETANVTLEAEYVRQFPEWKAGEYVQLAVTDTGAGMSEEVKARIFEPFFTTKGVGEGVGLGLATCYGIVKQSGGHLVVYSEQNRGTVFKIFLPQFESGGKAVGPGLAPPELPRGTETILLAEDDRVLREMAASLLERLGYTVFTAANGVEALELKLPSGAGDFDLLFTDLVMPQMDGKALAATMRERHPRTKILFCVGLYGEGHRPPRGVWPGGVAAAKAVHAGGAGAKTARGAGWAGVPIERRQSEPAVKEKRTKSRLIPYRIFGGNSV